MVCFGQEANYRYSVEQEVEVYTNDLHAWTDHATIVARKTARHPKINGAKAYCGFYQVVFRDKPNGNHKNYDWVTAEDIES